MLTLEQTRIAVIGLGYVGLPLAVAFGRRHATVGYDISAERIDELRGGSDSTLEVRAEDLVAANRLSFTTDLQDIAESNVYIVTVPTPVGTAMRPNLGPLRAASETAGSVLSAGDIVVYESTVYPGATEEFCVPILEQHSGLSFNQDFFVGYSPERINPGDRTHRLETIVKVTAGSTPQAGAFVDELYAGIVQAGTHRASSIRVAEAAKVIENTQRDVNIALINELAMIFDRLGIDSREVLEAAGTKWNFLPFWPGLVGGHCIGVDPYYLTYKCQEVGYHPEMILAGRRINDNMGLYVAEQVARLMIAKRIHLAESRVLILGLTFKENCPDLRNTRVIDVIRELEGFGAQIDVHDPWVNPEEAREEYGVNPVRDPAEGEYDAIVLAVGHEQFHDMGIDDIKAFGKNPCVLYDVKSILPAEAVDGRL